MDIPIQPIELKAGLYIVATPIGHLKDITIHALEILMSVDFILCEDTRVSKKLLSAYQIQKPVESLHDHNEAQKAQYILEHILDGKRIALISDAGTPLISDPGYKLVKHLSSEDIYITHMPGASSINTAIVLSALPTDQFIFKGFLPAKLQAKKNMLQQLKKMQITAVVLESPHRILSSLNEIYTIFGEDHPVSLCRELTKRYEQVLRMRALDLYEYAKENQGFKGEITLVLAPSKNQDVVIDTDGLLMEALKNYRIKDAAHMVFEQTGIPKKELYHRALQLKNNEHI